MKSLYLLIDLFSVAVPFAFSFHPKIQFYKTLKAAFLSHIIVGVLFLVWDSIFTAHGIWGFNEKYITGIYIFNLPIEEVLFFICIPYACLFTYYCLLLFYGWDLKTKTTNAIVAMLSILFLVIGIIFLNQYYTSCTFISTAFILSFMQFVLRVNWIGKLLRIYPILLIPFIIVNGILTGTGLDEPVVWYNDSRNLGIRLLTIPIEDVVYGFEMILLTIFFYAFYVKKLKLVSKTSV